MKKFNPFSIFRKASKMLVAVIFFFAVGVAAVASVHSHQKAGQSVGAEKAHYQNQEKTANLVLMFVVGSVVIMHTTVAPNLGFQKTRIYVPELGYELSYAGYTLWNFLTKSKDARKQTIEDLMAGNLRIRSFAESFKFSIVGQSGNREIFTSANGPWRQGRIPELFNDAKLPNGTNVAISHMAASYVTDAAVTVPEGMATFSRVVTAWPAALANSELVIKQGAGIKEQLQLKNAASQANGFLSGVETDGYEFEVPFVLEEEKAIKFELRYAEALAVPGTNNHFLSLDMIGAVCTKK
jgi:hypothetical protein